VGMVPRRCSVPVSAVRGMLTSAMTYSINTYLTRRKVYSLLLNRKTASSHLMQLVPGSNKLDR
jgi:hypothetical protein